MLLEECRRARARVVCDCRVDAVERATSFVVKTSRGTFTAESLVVATGGLSVTQLGATDFGYRLARQFGLRVRATRPGLVPFTLPAARLKELGALSGVSVDALAECNGAEFRENILLTHRGLSGPAILQVSSYWMPGDALTLNLLPETDAFEWLASNLRSGDDAREPARAAPAAAFRARVVRDARAGKASAAVHAERVGGGGGESACVETHAGGDGRVQEGGGDGGRGRHRRAFVEDDGGSAGAGAVLHRRGRGRDGPPRRAQLPVGLVVGLRRRPTRIREGARRDWRQFAFVCESSWVCKGNTD